MTTAPRLLDLPARASLDAQWPDDLRLLLGPEAGELLAAIVGEAGGRLGPWRARQVNHQPGRSTVVQYRADVQWPDGSVTGETLIAATGDRRPKRDAAVFDDGSTRVAVWRWPADPFLPGLAAANDPPAVGALLDDLGIDGGAVQLRTRAYRPGRRAVIEATGRRGRLFLKVVSPTRAEALHQIHRRLAPRLPVPDSLGWTENGVVVLPALPGKTLRDALRSNHDPAPPPEAIVALLDSLPAELGDGPVRRDLLSLAQHHATVIAQTLPEAGGHLDSLLEQLRPGDGVDQHPVVAVHGDLYESQLLVENGRVTGLLDIDTAGAGFRADDLANMCAHLSVVALDMDRPTLVKRYGAALLAYGERSHDPADLRRRIAAAVLGLATGPFRVLEARWPENTLRRLDLASAWLTNPR